jgi:hypothetical protein
VLAEAPLSWTSKAAAEAPSKWAERWIVGELFDSARGRDESGARMGKGPVVHSYTPRR